MPVAPKMHSRPGTNSLKPATLLKRVLFVVNIPLVVVASALIVFGLMVVWTAVLEAPEYSFQRQAMGVIIGLAVMAVIWGMDYHRLATFTLPLLIIDIILILSPLMPFIGVTVNGANSWIIIFGQQLQPGELAKIVTILFMASLVSRYDGKLTSGREYIKAIALLCVPLLCILMQPDLGTGMVFFAIGLVVLFTGGANRKWLIITAIIIIAAVVLVFMLDPYFDSLFGRDVFLKEYQKNRMLVFLDEDIDPTGVSYNLKQAKIAIGSGGLLGKGIGNATQSGLGFLPEAPTDFIFCVLAETFGFVGSAALITLYALLFIVVFYIALNSDDLYGTLIVMGILGMWVFQIFENIGMTCGLMPITGIPLPFMSYGSSFMVVNFIALGLILSVWAHRDKKKV